MSAAITRRAAIGSAIAGTAVIAVPGAAQAPKVSPGLTSAIAAYHRADARHSAFITDVLGPAEKAHWRAMKEAGDAVPRHRTVNGFVNVYEDRITLTTENDVSVDMARRVLVDVDKGLLYSKPAASEDDDYIATIREIVAAADARDAEIRRIKERIKADHSTNIHDLRAKTDFIEVNCLWEEPEAQEGIAADARRLAGAI